MISNKWIVQLTILIALVSQIHAACVCNEKGSDYCAGCTNRRVVRPKQKYTDGNPGIDLSPIGDSCSCSKVMIEPASLPKPCSKHKKTSPSCGCKSSGYGSSSSCGCRGSAGYGSSSSSGYGSSSSSGYDSSSSSSSSSYDSLKSIFSSPSSSGSYVVPQVNYVSTVSKNDDSLPADPLSVSLAVQAGKAIEVPEAKLAYGFVQKPIDGLPKVYISSVKEENLYALNNDVITLKKPTSSSARSSQKPAEDYPEPEDEETNAENGTANEEDEPPRLTYKQLGYETEQFRNPQFQEVASSYAYASGNTHQTSVVSGRVSVDCGYKPGRIAKYRGRKNYGDLDSCYERT